MIFSSFRCRISKLTHCKVRLSRTHRAPDPAAALAGLFEDVHHVVPLADDGEQEEDQVDDAVHDADEENCARGSVLSCEGGRRRSA